VAIERLHEHHLNSRTLTVVLGADDGFAVSVDGAAPSDYDDGSLELGATVDP